MSKSRRGDWFCATATATGKKHRSADGNRRRRIPGQLKFFPQEYPGKDTGEYRCRAQGGHRGNYHARQLHSGEKSQLKRRNKDRPCQYRRERPGSAGRLPQKSGTARDQDAGDDDAKCPHGDRVYIGGTESLDCPGGSPDKGCYQNQDNSLQFALSGCESGWCIGHGEMSIANQGPRCYLLARCPRPGTRGPVLRRRKTGRRLEQ